jgi:hypothetical protein
MISSDVRGGVNNPLLFSFKKEENSKENEFFVSVFNLYIFDEYDNLITELKCLSDGYIRIHPNNSQIGEIYANSVVHNSDLQNFIHNGHDENLTDFEMLLSPKVNKYTINSDPHGPDCKVVAKIEVRNNQNQMVKDYTVIAYDALIKNNYNLVTTSNGVSTEEYFIVARPYNDQGDIFEIQEIYK